MRGLGIAAAVLIALFALSELVLAVVASTTDGPIAGYIAGNGTSVAAFNEAVLLLTLTNLASVVMFAAAIVMFLVWLWRARVNAELLCRAQHTRSRVWTLLGWFVPIVSLWFPFQAVRDVWKASHPAAAPEGYNMHGMSFTKVLGWWWAVWLADLSLFQFINNRELDESFDPVADDIAVSFVLSAVAGGLLIRLILQISSWQEAKMSQQPVVAGY